MSIEKRIIFHRGIHRILPIRFIDSSGKKVELEPEDMSDELRECMVPYDLEFVTELEKKFRENYVQVVRKSDDKWIPTMVNFSELPKGLFVATADWVGDGRLITFDPTTWIEKNYYKEIHKLPYDAQLKCMKYSAGPMCPSAFPKDMKIEFVEGKDKMGTILVNPEIAHKTLVKHRYAPYEITHLLEGTKIRGPFIKGTVVYSTEVEGIRFLTGSYKNIPEGPDMAIKCGFWVENLPHYLLGDKVTISYTVYEHLTVGDIHLPHKTSIDNMINMSMTREKLYRHLLFDTNGQLQLLRVIEAIRQGVPTNFGFPRQYINKRITDELDRKVFNPKVFGVRAVGVAHETGKKEVIIPIEFASHFPKGTKVVLWRNPVTWIGSIQVVKVGGYTTSPVIRVPYRSAKASLGDFDGDQYQIVSLKIFESIFNCDLKHILESTPPPIEYTVTKEVIPSGKDKQILYNIAKQVEMGKRATGIMIHYRDNAVVRRLTTPRGVEHIYLNGAQNVLQSKNAVKKDVDYSQYPFEVAKKLAGELGINYTKLIGKNKTLSMLRKRATYYGKYEPEEESVLYEDLKIYEREAIKEFNPLSVTEMMRKHIDLSTTQIKTAKRFIYSLTQVDKTLQEKEELVYNYMKTNGITKMNMVYALLESAKGQRFGYEIVLAQRLIDADMSTKEQTKTVKLSFSA